MADTTGTFVLTVSTPVLPGEAVAENNSRSFVLRVIRDRVRVLLVAGRPWGVTSAFALWGAKDRKSTRLNSSHT